MRKIGIFANAEDIENAEIAKDIEGAKIVSISQILDTVKQENFATGNFHDFKGKTISQQKNCTNLGIEGILIL